MKFKSNPLVWLVLVLVGLAVANVVMSNVIGTNTTELNYSGLWKAVNENQVKNVEIQGTAVNGVDVNNKTFTAVIPQNDGALLNEMRDKNVAITIKSTERNSFISLLISWLPILLMIGVFIFFMRQSAKGGGAMAFGRSRAKLNKKLGKVTFADVAGVEEAKEELSEIVEYLKNPAKFQKLGAKLPKGALLVGPPGTGKTLLARAVAGEANVPFFNISGSDFVEMFVGVGAARVRDMFEQAKKTAPCLVFIDEIDAVGRHRGAGLGGGNDEREQTLNQLLVEMDGFDEHQSVIILAATNRPDVLDPALLRPGRFDRQITVPNPDVLGRTKILQVHMMKVPLASDVKANVIARGTPGFSGADLANLVNEAALLAARKNKKTVSMNDFELAKDKVMMGPERRSMILSEKERELTAYHEAGHAIVGLNVPNYDPLHKVTIIPRGRALGVTMSLPKQDHTNYSYSMLQSRLAVFYGGRVAEELVYGKENITTGASSDIQQATGVARRMITEFGFSDKLGRVRYASNEQEIFLGHSVAQQRNISENTAMTIDNEILRIIQEAEETSRRILTEKRDDLEKLAKALLEYETLSGDEVNSLLSGEDLDAIRKAHEETIENEEKPIPKLSTLPSIDTSEKEEKKEEKPNVPE